MKNWNYFLDAVCSMSTQVSDGTDDHPVEIVALYIEHLSTNNESKFFVHANKEFLNQYLV